MAHLPKLVNDWFLLQLASGEERYAMGPQELAELGLEIEVPKSYEAYRDRFKNSSHNGGIQMSLATTQGQHQWMAAEVRERERERERERHRERQRETESS